MTPDIEARLKEIESHWTGNYGVFKSVQESIFWLISLIREQQEQLKKYREALEFYAGENHLDCVCETLEDPTFIGRDREGDVRVEDGFRARQALSKPECTCHTPPMGHCPLHQWAFPEPKYEYLGDFSSGPPYESREFVCEKCRVTWTGVGEECPRCKCVCSEINARHCPVHQEGGDE